MWLKKQRPASELAGRCVMMCKKVGRNRHASSHNHSTEPIKTDSARQQHACDDVNKYSIFYYFLICDSKIITNSAKILIIHPTFSKKTTLSLYSRYSLRVCVYVNGGGQSVGSLPMML